MSTISDRIKEINSKLPSSTRLVAVSKFHPANAIQEAYNAGQRIFGESRVQELVEKQAQLPHDIQWHFIGHLQSNKIKQIVPFISLIHSVDSLKLLKEINQQAEKIGRTINCLLEVHVAQEETKYGFSADEVKQLVKSGALQELSHVQVVGIMGMASNTDDEEQIRNEFHSLSALYHTLKDESQPQFTELSMGMSGDYPIAVSEGSTLVRIGTYLFGERNY